MRKVLLSILLLLLCLGSAEAATLAAGVNTQIAIALFDNATGLVKTGYTVTNISCRCIQSDMTTTSWTSTASGGSHDLVESGNGLYKQELVGSTDLNVAGKTAVLCSGSGVTSPLMIFDVVQDPAYQANINGDLAIPDDVLDVALSAHTTSGTSGAALNNLDAPTSSILSAISTVQVDVDDVQNRVPPIGTAQAGSANTITLASTESATSQVIRFSVIRIVSGTGAGQTAKISDYNGSTKVATIVCTNSTTNGNWITNPDATSVYLIYPASRSQ